VVGVGRDDEHDLVCVGIVGWRLVRPARGGDRRDLGIVWRRLAVPRRRREHAETRQVQLPELAGLDLPEPDLESEAAPRFVQGFGRIRRRELLKDELGVERRAVELGERAQRPDERFPFDPHPRPSPVLDAYRCVFRAQRSTAWPNNGSRLATTVYGYPPQDCNACPDTAGLKRACARFTPCGGQNGLVVLLEPNSQA